jgi:pyruvate formate lyase activating enzyme
MIIGGLEKMTLIDYPGQLAAIVFTKGCNFRCHFCYNPLLVWPDRETDEKKYEKTYPPISEDEFFLFLENRKGKLDGVVITGGEPTLHSDLPEFIKKIRAMGYNIKLDTNGTNSVALENLLNQKLIDYIAMDLKAPFDKYEQVVGISVNCQEIQKSVKMIIESGLPHEFRTTVVPGLHDLSDFSKMGEIITGADAWYLQKFKSDTELVDRTLESHAPFTDKEMQAMADVGKKYVKICEVR